MTDRDDTLRHTLTDEAKTGWPPSGNDEDEPVTYEQWRAKNDDSYGRRCFTYAEDWALLLEADMAAHPNKPVETIIVSYADLRSREADTDGITGFMYGMAVSILARSWVHGEELRRWHNLQTQTGTEGEEANESGGAGRHHRRRAGGRTRDAASDRVGSSA